MFIAKTPTFLQFFMPGYLWKGPATGKKLYLTFDDGPIPEVTPWVLDTLAQYQAKGTFFCVGDNIRKHPDVFQRIQNEGHSVGNHTFHHLNGWKTPTATYLDNVAQCQTLCPSNLFRPPYGRMSRAQKKALQPHFQLVMWDVLSGDFSRSLTPEQCLQNVLKNVVPGSIVVMHDSLKTKQNLEYVLPATLAYFSQKGYDFAALNDRPVQISRQ